MWNLEAMGGAGIKRKVSMEKDSTVHNASVCWGQGVYYLCFGAIDEFGVIRGFCECDDGLSYYLF